MEYTTPSSVSHAENSTRDVTFSPEPPATALLQAALIYAARGWRVFPCHTPTETGCSCLQADCNRIGKHPRTTHGKDDATTDEAQIRRWWTMWPDANIAIATGAGSDLVVLDVDPLKGGTESLSELEATYSPLPETVQQLTGTGEHDCFAHPGTHVGNSVGTLAPGLDIRGDGGYIIAAPSLHANGKRYTWELSHHPDETPLAPMPGWLLALCQEATRDPLHTGADRPALDVSAPLVDGERNDGLFRRGCSMRARGFDEAEIAGALRAANATKCHPPITEAEVLQIAASCARYEPGQAAAHLAVNGTGPPKAEPAPVDTAALLATLTAAPEDKRLALLTAAMPSLGTLDPDAWMLLKPQLKACVPGLTLKDAERAWTAHRKNHLKEQQVAAKSQQRSTRTGSPAAVRSPTDDDYPYSDAYNALRLVRTHGQDMRYCAPWKTWLTWAGTHWQRDTTGLLLRWQRLTIKALGAQLVTLKDDEADKLLAHITSSLNTTRLRAAIDQAHSWEGMTVGHEALDADPWVLNCANGTLDLQSGTLRPHRQSDLLTKCLAIPYDPAATCPTWHAFLWRIMGGSQGEDSPDMSVGELENRRVADEKAQSLIDFLQQAIGYTLTGSTREQCLFILHGPTKTGKSTFLALLRALLGPYGQQADVESFMHKDKAEVRNDLADLAGSRCVCALESQEGRRLAESLIKQMTGGVDTIKARFLYEEHFTFKPQFKIFLGTNHLPKISMDDAVWERVYRVPFIIQIPKEERDKSLEDRLQAELPGILAWAVEGCLAWQQAGELRVPAAVMEATADYHTAMDTLGRFLEECCLKDAAVRVKVGDLYAAYKQWCEQAGEKGVDSLTKVGQRLDVLGFEKKISGGTWRLGLGLIVP